jgi:hypothetical protein
MAKLPKSLIKKYGISKKAWSVFRGQKKSTHSGGMSNMAKKGHKNKSMFGLGTGSMIQPDAMVYGAARQFVANLIRPVTNMIPAGQYAEPVALGLVDWFVAKNTSGFISDAAKKGLVVENAMIGSNLVGGFGGSSGSSSIASYNSGFSY